MDYNFHHPHFNLQAPVDPTRFKLRPAPIVLQRVPSHHTPTLSGGQGLLPFDQRMELATRLAQREIEMKSTVQTEANSCCSCGQGMGPEVESTEEPHQPPSDKHPHIMKKPGIKPNTKPPHIPTYSKPSHVRSMTGHKVNTDVVQHKDKNIGVVGGKNMESEIEATSQEIRKLHKDLTRNMQRLKLLSLKADLDYPSRSIAESPVGVSSSVDGGRLGWIEDKSNQKKQVKAHGQAVRNARLVYQLQQKVRDAQRQLQAPKNSSKTRLLAMHRLASAHRTAIRTLHHMASISGGGVKHTSSHDEVAVLIDQLSRLCVDARVCGEESEDNMTSLMKELTDYHSQVKHLLRTSERPNLPNSPAIMAAKRFLSPQIMRGRKGTNHVKYKQRGVLLDPKLRVRRPAVTAKRTSLRDNTKPSNKRKAKHSSPTAVMVKPHPIHKPPSRPRPPHDIIHHHSPVPLLSPSLDSSQGVPRSEHDAVYNEAMGGALLPWEHPGQSIEEREKARQTWLDRKTLDIVEDLERAAKQKMSQQKECINEESPSDEDCLGNEEPDNRQRDIDSKRHAKTELSSVPMQELKKMIERIEEIERERIALQAKWQNVTDENFIRPSNGNGLDPHEIVSPDFSDGAHSPDASVSFKNPHVYVLDPENKARLSDTCTGPNIDSSSRPNIDPSDTRPSDTIPCSTTPNPILLRNGKLPVTDFRINRVLNPKQLQIETIADDILQDLIKGTSLELRDVIHTCVKQLYDNEFHSPPTTAHQQMNRQV